MKYSYILLFFLSILILCSACHRETDATVELKEGVYEFGVSYQRGTKQYQEKYLYKLNKDGNQLSLKDSELMNDEHVSHPTLDPPMTGFIKEDAIYLIWEQTKETWEERNKKSFPLDLYFPLKLTSDNRAQFNWQPPSSYWDTIGEEKHFSKVSLSLSSEELVNEECAKVYEKTSELKGSTRFKELFLKRCLTDVLPQGRTCVLASTNPKDCKSSSTIFESKQSSSMSISQPQDVLVVKEHLNDLIHQLRDVELTEYQNSSTFFSCEPSECEQYVDKLQENELIEAHVVNGTLIMRAKLKSRDVSVSHLIEPYHKNSYKNPAAKNPAFYKDLHHRLRQALWDVFQKAGASPEKSHWNRTYVHCTKNNVRRKNSSHHSEVDSCSKPYGLTLKPQDYMNVHGNDGGLWLRGKAKDAVIPSYTTELFLGDLPHDYKTVPRKIQQDPSLWFDDSYVRSAIFSLNTPPDGKIVVDDYERVKEREMIVTGRVLSDIGLGAETIGLRFNKTIATVETLSIEPITGDNHYKFRFKLKVFAR